MADKKINGSLEITGKLNPNGSGYGFNLPDNSSLTADKIIATTDDISNLKGSTLITQGTFQNGEFEINFENTPLEDGLYFFTYGLAQAFVYITRAMLEAWTTTQTPIRAAIPVIYGNGGQTQPGSLKINLGNFYTTPDGNLVIQSLRVSVANENHTVRDGFVMYIYKTNAM